jgi:hypothetical protein
LRTKEILPFYPTTGASFPDDHGIAVLGLDNISGIIWYGKYGASIKRGIRS